MEELDPRFLAEVLRLCRLDGIFEGAGDALRKLNASVKICDGKPFFTLEEAEDIAEVLAKHGLSRSADILVEWASQDLRYRKLSTDAVIAELQRSIERELHSNLFLHVGEDRRKFYEEKYHFGDKVAKSFPSALVDIEEAGKCYALSRYTACVFHLMRVMESALRVLAATLKDPRLDPKRNPSWDSVLRKCYEELGKDRLKRAPEWAADDKFFSDVSARLMAVKDAWRNPTMHVEIDYDDEKALDVWNHVCAFMRHISTKLSE